MRSVRINKSGLAIVVGFLGVAILIYLSLSRGSSKGAKVGGIIRASEDDKVDASRMYNKIDVETGAKAVEIDKVKRSRSKDKVSAGGKYLSFYGYSINAPVVDGKKCALIEKYIKNSKTLSRFLSPLPASSYHVTIFEIFSQRNVPKKYKPKSDAVPSTHWSKIMPELKRELSEAQKKCDVIIGEFEFKVEKLAFRKTGVVLLGTLSNMSVISKLRQELSEVFQKHEDRIFHLSLGYIYNTDITDKDMKEINNELEGLWKIINQSYKLDPPLVYYYETMEEFIPFMQAGLT